MAMEQTRLHIELTLAAPILTHASTAGKVGVDAAAAKTADGRCLLPFSLIKGRVRQSWDELALPDAEEWFGKRMGGWKGSRGRFRFSDFVEQGSAERETTAEIHRIRTD